MSTVQIRSEFLVSMSQKAAWKVETSYLELNTMNNITNERNRTNEIL
uniref:Uncharacterized protein n=1 Tax=Arundo donax TaxID=35708 RepID=A0A0A9BZ19_ARUDO